MTIRAPNLASRILISSFVFMNATFGLTPESALAVEIPKEFRGTWCAQSKDIKGDWGAYPTDSECDGFTLSITALDLKVADQSMSCVIRDVRKFDVCPWGMTFKDRQQARRERPGQINPWSPGFRLLFECTSSGKRAEVAAVDWVIEKGSITGGVPLSYRCPWDRK